MEDLNNKPSTEKKYTCDICENSFKTKREVNIHKEVHIEESPYKCDKCGSSNLSIHQSVHSGVRPFKCNSCGKQFAQIYQDIKGNKSLKSIAKKDDKKEYECDFCGKFFETKKYVTVHMRLHWLHCDLCDANFSKKRSLLKHLKACKRKRAHTG